ncbi:uridine kinase family protein [Konateibacter massiliensis]|uniref:uridine kinase family protein n=1 Tax=Konateibacter massiliensis TaxID=2002841 RepID=UPI000C156FB0|nr:hypothetical protein [Konateibacter massiliensis]
MVKEQKNIMKEACAKRFAPAREAIDKLLSNSSKDILLIAIDGKCASGKTTLGYYLQELYGCNLFHLDDFFLQEHQRTKERFLEIGGNVDYERFRAEVVEPVLSGETVSYKPYDCMTKQFKQETLIFKSRLNIMEGSYSMHPYFKNPYDINIFLNIDDEEQIANIRERNGEEKLKRFIEEWIPKENIYFQTFQIEEGCIRIEWGSR